MSFMFGCKCPTHGLPLLFICTNRNCNQLMTICSDCKHLHQGHHDKFIQAQRINGSILSAVNTQNARDVEAMKVNDALQLQLTKLKKQYSDREKELLAGIIKRLQIEKKEIVRSVMEQRRKIQRANNAYFEKITQNGLLQYRIIFSSQKGIESLYDGYRRYCQSEGVAPHIEVEKLPDLDEDDEIQITELIKNSMARTMTQSITNFIKLRVSKRDAMKVSCVLATSGSVMRAKNIGLPPPSPTKKLKPK